MNATADSINLKLEELKIQQSSKPFDIDTKIGKGVLVIFYSNESIDKLKNLD